MKGQVSPVSSVARVRARGDGNVSVVNARAWSATR